MTTSSEGNGATGVNTTKAVNTAKAGEAAIGGVVGAIPGLRQFV